MSTGISTSTTSDEPRLSADEAFLKKVKKRFDRAAGAEAKNRLAAVEDLKFKNGEQWPEGIKSARANDRRPCLTVNKMKTFIHQVTNAQRENRPAINISLAGDRGHPDTATILKGLIRAIERASDADVAYDTAFESAVSNGFGYWRILTDYESDSSFNQVIRIDRIRNPFSVYLDPAHVMPDGSDAKWAFITEMIARDDFESLYPDADSMPWDNKGIGDDNRNWSNESAIRVAEYWEYDHEERRLVALENGFTGFFEDLDEPVKRAIVSGELKTLNDREVQVPVLKYRKLTAKEILEEQEWPGKYIPIVKVIGDEVDIEGKVTYAGVIRDAKDAQRMYNYWVTAETEQVALAPKAPYIGAEGQFEGYEAMWKTANQVSRPYLQYKAIDINGHLVPPPQRQPFAGPPAGIIEAKAGAAQDMMATTGVRFDATLNERMIDESGKAINELRRSGDIGAYHYLDNLGRSLKYTGRILLDLIPKIYDTKRVLTILGDSDKEERVQADPNGPPYAEYKTQTGTMKAFNPTVGEYAVAVTIGPSYATKRIEAANSIIEYLRVDPQVAPLVRDILAKNLDWPGAEELAARFAKTIPPNMLEYSKDLSPQAQAVITQLQQHLQAAQQQMQQMAHALTEKGSDRAVAMHQIERDYDAKIKKLEEDFAKAMMTKGPAAQGGHAGHAQHGAHSPKDIVAGLQEILSAHQKAEEERMAKEAEQHKLGEMDDIRKTLGLLHEHLTSPRETQIMRDSEGRVTGAVSHGPHGRKVTHLHRDEAGQATGATTETLQ